MPISTDGAKSTTFTTGAEGTKVVKELDARADGLSQAMGESGVCATHTSAMLPEIIAKKLYWTDARGAGSH